MKVKCTSRQVLVEIAVVFTREGVMKSAHLSKKPAWSAAQRCRGTGDVYEKVWLAVPYATAEELGQVAACEEAGRTRKRNVRKAKAVKKSPMLGLLD